jgi:uncharacterized membrane protein
VAVSRQRGQVTFLGVGLALLLLGTGGFAVDLWRVLLARRALAEAADSAAAAGANAVDRNHYRRTGEVRLAPDLAVAVVLASLAAQPDLPAISGPPRVEAGTDRVTVELWGEVELTLLRLFARGEPVTVRVTAEAVPIRGP